MARPRKCPTCGKNIPPSIGVCALCALLESHLSTYLATDMGRARILQAMEQFRKRKAV